MADSSFLEEFIRDNYPKWSTDGYGDESNLVCPHGHIIEQDGHCPEGCVSPLIQMGLI